MVITGASRGLGVLLAHSFSKSGAAVALVARTEKDLEAVADATVAEWGALDLAPAGISVNVVAPGWFDSPLADGWKSSPELSAAITRHTAQERWGRPTDLAGAYQFLASDASAFVTGTVVSVDGGYLLV